MKIYDVYKLLRYIKYLHNLRLHIDYHSRFYTTEPMILFVTCSLNVNQIEDTNVGET